MKNRHSRTIWAHFKNTTMGSNEARLLMRPEILEAYLKAMVLDHLRQQDDSVSWDTLRDDVDQIVEELTVKLEDWVK